VVKFALQDRTTGRQGWWLDIAKFWQRATIDAIDAIDAAVISQDIQDASGCIRMPYLRGIGVVQCVGPSVESL